MRHAWSYQVQIVLDLGSGSNAAHIAHYLVKAYELVHALVLLEAIYNHLIGHLSIRVNVSFQLILVNHALQSEAREKFFGNYQDVSR